MKKLIGFCGYARVGKNTAAEELAKLLPDQTFHLHGYADSLKDDLNKCIIWARHHGIDTTTDKFKETIRPMYVLWSRVAKDLAEDETIWVQRKQPMLERCWKNGVIPLLCDVRYSYEIDSIYEQGGVVIFINRPEFGPKNEEEEKSFAEIIEKYGDLMEQNSIVNDSTKEILGKRVLKMLGKL